MNFDHSTAAMYDRMIENMRIQKRTAVKHRPSKVKT